MKTKVLTFIFLVCVSFSLSADPWAQVTVTWSGACVIPDQNAVYVITLKVWNSETSTWVYNSTVQQSTSSSPSHTFDLTQFCTPDQEESIFKIYAIVKKVRIPDGAIICDGHNETGWKNCSDIVSSPITISVALL